MRNKAIVLFMFGVALYFILRAYYRQGNTGLPNPQVLSAPTYLYGILALAADFLAGFPIVLAAGLTMALVWQAQGVDPKTGKVTDSTSVNPAVNPKAYGPVKPSTAYGSGNTPSKSNMKAG